MSNLFRSTTKIRDVSNDNVLSLQFMKYVIRDINIDIDVIKDSLKNEYLTKEINVQLQIVQRTIDLFNDIMTLLLKYDIQDKIDLMNTSITTLTKIKKVFRKFKLILIEPPTCFYFCCKSKHQRLREELEQTMEIIMCENKILNNTLASHFGVSLQIKNPIFKACWLIMANNQLNNTTVSKQILFESLLSLLNKEIERTLPIYMKYVELIHALIDYIHISNKCNGDPNISIFELNSFSTTINNSIIELLNSFNMNKSVNINNYIYNSA